MRERTGILSPSGRDDTNGVILALVAVGLPN